MALAKVLISKTSKLPVLDREFVMSWISDINNIIDSIPSAVRSGNTVIIELRSGIIKKKLKLNYYVRISKNFFQITLMDNENMLRISVITGQEPLFRVEYIGNNENDFKKIVEDIEKYIKEKIYVSYMEHKNHSKDNTLSERLKSISFVSRIVSRSKLIVEEEVYTTDVMSTIGEILASISPEPVLYISGYGDGVFRLILVNGEIKGAYVSYEGNESYSEKDLRNLKGRFKISVYSTNLGDILSIME